MIQGVLMQSVVIEQTHKLQRLINKNIYWIKISDILLLLLLLIITHTTHTHTCTRWTLLLKVLSKLHQINKWTAVVCGFLQLRANVAKWVWGPYGLWTDLFQPANPIPQTFFSAYTEKGKHMLRIITNMAFWSSGNLSLNANSLKSQPSFTKRV